MEVGGLLGVAALHASPTAPAAADTDPEAGHHWPGLRQFGLELLGPPLELDAAPQSGQHSGSGASRLRSVSDGAGR